MVTIYRWLILVNIMLYCAYLIIPFFDSYLVDESERYILSYSGHDYLYGITSIASWLFVGALLLAMLGMYFFIYKSRIIFSLLLCIGLIITFVSGMVVETGFEAFLYELHCVLNGAILSIAYFSSLSDRFYSIDTIDKGPGSN